MSLIYTTIVPTLLVLVLQIIISQMKVFGGAIKLHLDE